MSFLERSINHRELFLVNMYHIDSVKDDTRSNNFKRSLKHTRIHLKLRKLILHQKTIG